MKKGFRGGLLTVASVLVLAVSCDRARISGVVADAPGTEIVLNRFDLNKLQPVDTIVTDARGRFSVKVVAAKGNPEFYYFNRRGVKLASVLAASGDRLKVEADTLGNFSVSGSADAELFSQVERSYREFNAKMTDCADRLAAAPEDKELAKELTANYVAYYRDRVRFMMENSHSIAVIPVFYQKAGSLPLFDQATDAIHFTNICDSLETVYPESRYVRALRAEAARRMSVLSTVTLINTAVPTAFPDIELPDLQAEKKKLSEVEGKLVMLYFWAGNVPEQRQFNLEVLKPVYQAYHARGLEIYQVALDPDKGGWASTVKSQNLPWINVCDIRGVQSRYVSLYNLKGLPALFLIHEGELIQTEISTAADLVKTLDKLLK